MATKIPIRMLVRTAGTQHRPTDPDLVARYAEKWSDDFPPVSVIQTNDNELILYDGFHRCAAAERAGKTTIKAKVEHGTRREAIKRSFGVNTDHGLLRDGATTRLCLQKILLDPEWSKASQRDLAEMLNITQPRVCQLLAEIQAEKKATPKKAKAARPRVEPTTAPPKTAVEPGRPTDQEGVPLPEHLIPIFERRREILAWRGHVDALWDCVKEAIESGDPFFRYVRVETIKTECMNLRRAIKFAMPYAVCAYCSGDGGVNKDCRACAGSGWVNEETWYATPQEYKAAMKKLAEVHGKE